MNSSANKDLAVFKQCPNGHEVSEEMSFCPVCGAKIASGGIRFCPNCGTERHATDRFCQNCGLPFFRQSQRIEEKSEDSSFFGFLWIDF